MCRVIIFGTGGLSQFLTEHIRDNITILAYMENNKGLKKIGEIPVISVNELDKYNYDYIIVAFSAVEQGLEILKGKGVKENKIICYHYNGAYNYDNNPYQIQCDKLLEARLNTQKIKDIFLLPDKKYYLCSMNIPDNRNVIERDFVREQTLALIAKEIKRKNIEGSVAELGVFKGEFAKKINTLFTDKKLYLFDTYEGFVEDEVKNDNTIKWGSNHERFKNTTIEAVLNLMPNRSKCVIKKGIFPESFDLRNETFCFVSIDVDLYDPIKAGLEIFYPRLAIGGYIMIHDYNNIIYQGTKIAVQQYCDERKISYVPIPDMAGSIIITKSN